MNEVIKEIRGFEGRCTISVDNIINNTTWSNK